MNKYIYFTEKLMFSIISCLLAHSYAAAEATGLADHEVVYNLSIHHKTAEFSKGYVSQALAINNQIPAPTLKFHKGDTAVINVTNNLNEPTTLHWHGLLVPWNMDGPAFTNNKLIQPGETFQFRFPIKQTGTYWYHSHTMLQEQQGLYGAIVIEDHHDHYGVDHDEVVVLSDWINDHPMDVLKNLKSDGDYYAFKKSFFPSVIGAIRAGAIWDYIKGEWSRMGPMDLSDVGYDAFLANGQTSQVWENIRPGQKVRVRVINAGSSTYFYLNLGQLRPFQVIEKDGQPVVPVSVSEVLIGMGETYDLLFEMPNMGHAMGIEFRATAQDITGYSQVFLGRGHHTETVPDKMKPNPYKMDHGGHDHQPGHGDHTGHEMASSDHSGHEGHGDHGGGHDGHDGDMPMSDRLQLSQLKSPTATAFDASLPRRDVHLKLTGDMERYYWTLNGKPFSEEKYLEVHYNEVVRVTFVNETMMHHPMHLHGHFFRVLNGQGDFSPKFHTLDVAPMQSYTVEFWTNEPGIWFLHCHNLYHMMMGMARLVKYDNFELPNDLVEYAKQHAGHEMNDSTPFVSGSVGLFTNHAEVNVLARAGRWDVELTYQTDQYKSGATEAELLFKRYVNNALSLVGGARHEDHELKAVLGLAYNLPLNIETEVLAQSDGSFKIKLRKSISIYDRLTLHLEPEWETATSDSASAYQFGSSLDYVISPKAKLGVFYKKTDEFGDSVGFGFRIGF